MTITRTHEDDILVLNMAGRFDSYWADNVAAEIDAAIHDGSSRLMLDFAQVAFMSSAGISVLLRYYKAAAALDGFLRVRNPIDAVRTVFDLSGLTPILLASTLPAAPTATSSEDTFTRERIRFEAYTQKGSAVTCRVAGSSAPLATAGYGADDLFRMRFPASAGGFGIGAFGRDYEESRGRFGEFVAIAGHVIHLPTDGTGVPDYLVSRGSFIPELNVLNGCAFSGAMPHCLRFEPDEEEATADLALLARTACERTAADAVVMVVIAEVAGLVGAALARSPDAGAEGSILTYPRLREWMSLTAEPAHAGDLALIAGLCVRSSAAAALPETSATTAPLPASAIPPRVRELLRPMSAAPELSAHLHAAVAPYSALKRGALDLIVTMTDVFAHGGVHSVLHLLDDDRPVHGAGTSQLMRGAMWCAAVSAFED